MEPSPIPYALTELPTYRLTALAAFLRSQSNLSDERPHDPGPGHVSLNNEEAAICALAIEAEVERREVAEQAGD
jgi:hypothetical protein